VHLRALTFLESKFGLKVGLSDHTPGISVAIGAVCFGVKVVEKHFILNKRLNTPDSAFSMDPEEFGEMVKNIRIIEKALGDSEYKYTKIMKEARKMARSLFAIKDIKKREKFTKDNIKSLRPGAGLHPKEYENVIGRFAKRDIKKGEPLNWKIIENGKKSV
jgi:pseudaminic acid synthase